MPLLDSQLVQQLSEFWADLPRPVEFRFHQGPPGEAREVMEQLLSELVAIRPDRLRQVPVPEAPVVEPGHDDGSPLEGPILTLAAAGEATSGVRFLGMTVGLEFGALVESVRAVSSGDPGLAPSSLEQLGRLTRPVHLQVFTTPT